MTGLAVACSRSSRRRFTSGLTSSLCRWAPLKSRVSCVLRKITNLRDPSGSNAASRKRRDT
ncbi:hypothetical protein CN128_01105 [Sinorhizobium meliloti]|nr:hypothetical protein CN235_00375 [Sinorhizobium meliloti]RVG16350.1 hypothetical protein CN234_00375 [Sinorhizobium meliloti]RVG26809.1 hypothetical protein CN233_23215 [Sinorhizobium meliloti]RVG57468.1 hypothetical protein CN226_00990 [Sinorhizobium meliloti]RVG73969.1 hypothetical protein CN220_06455 [Sinorhizobium meliloti]